MNKKKYTVSELMAMGQEEIEMICGGCIRGECPFPKRFMKLREDGFCIKECYEHTKEWIGCDNAEIAEIKRRRDNAIKLIKRRIKRYEKLIKEIENYLSKEESE